MPETPSKSVLQSFKRKGEMLRADPCVAGRLATALSLALSGAIAVHGTAASRRNDQRFVRDLPQATSFGHM